ncbi:MAG TPA: glycosyl hydrolase [Solirubrobacterales bacterium]|nr:glycosyl hydrolase [Solirubrobacterales bacterium]
MPALLAIRHPKRFPAAGLLVALLLALLVCAPATGAAAAGKNKRHPHPRKVKPKPVYWGAWIGDQLTGEAAPWDMNAAYKFEEILGKGMSLLQFSSPFQYCDGSTCYLYEFPEEAMQDIRNHGSIPFFSWGAEVAPRVNEVQPDYQLADLIEGRHDAYIRQFAGEVRAWGHPFFLRFNWEMNGDWFPWSEGANGNVPGQYVAAWRHVRDVFNSVGATNATWVWCPFADAKGRLADIRSLYPGDEYVDWACMDGYNWGKSPVNAQRWKSFGQLFDKTYEQLTKKVARRKPIMLAEFASSPHGGHKALWIKNMFEKLPRKYPRIRGLIWFDSFDRGVNWPLETSATATRAFSRGIGKRRYLDNRFSELAESPIRPLP